MIPQSTFLIYKNAIKSNEIRQDPLPIKGCMELHMLCFDLDGSIQAKVNTCSCDECLLGKFISCSEEKGYTVVAIDNDTSDSDSDIEYEMEDFSEEPEFDSEIYEIRKENIIDIVKEGNTIALYSPPYANVSVVLNSVD